MGFLLMIARAFINTFGITQPGPKGERNMAYYIGALLALIVLGMIVALAAFLSIKR
jgi:archaellum biogenesis protein FlaJ (TadC family)